MKLGAKQVIQFFPSIRSWVIGGFFALAWKLLNMVEVNPSLLKDQIFAAIVTAVIISGGLAIIVGNLFGGTKVGSEVMKSNADAVVASPPVTPPAP